MSDERGIPCEDETFAQPRGWNIIITVNSKSALIPPITKAVGYYGDPMRIATDIVNKGYTHVHNEHMFTVYPAHRIDEVFVRRQPE